MTSVTVKCSTIYAVVERCLEKYVSTIARGPSTRSYGSPTRCVGLYRSRGGEIRLVSNSLSTRFGSSKFSPGKTQAPGPVVRQDLLRLTSNSHLDGVGCFYILQETWGFVNSKVRASVHLGYAPDARSERRSNRVHLGSVLELMRTSAPWSRRQMLSVPNVVRGIATTGVMHPGLVFFLPRRRQGRFVVLACVTALVGVVTGCSSSDVTSGAPPLKVCGTTLWNGAAGAVSYQVTPHMAPIRTLTAGDVIYLQVAPGCDHGAVVSIPAGAATITATARAKDHRAAAVAIKPQEKKFTVTVRRQGQTS